MSSLLAIITVLEMEDKVQAKLENSPALHSRSICTSSVKNKVGLYIFSENNSSRRVQKCLQCLSAL